MPVLPQSTACACAGARRVGRAVTHLYDQVLVPTGLKATQFMMLRAIAEAGEIAHCELATGLAASVETLSRRLASARQSGLVRVRGGQHNKRLYSLTPKGIELLEQAMPYWEKAQVRLQRALGESDWLLLLNFSRRLADAAMEAEVLPIANGIHLDDSSPTPEIHAGQVAIATSVRHPVKTSTA